MVELGRLLGEGRTAEVHEYGESHVVKLLRTGFAERLLDEEAEATAMAAETGAPAPTVHGRVWLRGRPGAVLGRVDGVSLLDLILEAPDRWELGEAAGAYSCPDTRPRSPWTCGSQGGPPRPHLIDHHAVGETACLDPRHPRLARGR